MNNYTDLKADDRQMDTPCWRALIAIRNRDSVYIGLFQNIPGHRRAYHTRAVSAKLNDVRHSQTITVSIA